MKDSAGGLRVGFIGAGQMGRPMVDRLARAGAEVEVFARRPEARADLESAGITATADAVGLAGRSDLVIVCVFDDSQLRDIALDGGVLGAMRPGSVLASHVTGSPSLATQLEAAVPAGVTVLDVPISGTADHIRRGELTLLVGGDATALARVRPALEAYGQPILHVGAHVGDGQRIKLLNNLLFTVNLAAAVEAAQLGREMGIEPADLADVLAECSGASFALGLLQHRTPEAISTSVRRYLAKDVAVIDAVAAETGLDLGALGDRARWVFSG